MLTFALLQTILGRLPGLSIAVVGDLFLDKYLDLEATLTETSLETGLDAYQVVRVRSHPGAGGTVLNNLRGLGVGRLSAISVIGDDGEGYDLLRALHDRQIDAASVLRTSDRMTPTYMKPMLLGQQGPRELNRLDIRNREEPSAGIDRWVISQLSERIGEFDAVIVADQVSERNRGVVTDAVRDELARLAAEHPSRIFFADSRAHLALFRNLIVKPNRDELRHATTPATTTGTRAATAGDAVDREALGAAARSLNQQVGGPVYTTLGEAGIMYIDGNETFHVPGVAVFGPIDIVGAGDSTTAGIVCGLCGGATPREAAELGCLVASITIQKLGETGTATPAEVVARFQEHHSASR